MLCRRRRESRDAERAMINLSLSHTPDHSEPDAPELLYMHLISSVKYQVTNNSVLLSFSDSTVLVYSQISQFYMTYLQKLVFIYHIRAVFRGSCDCVCSE